MIHSPPPDPPPTHEAAWAVASLVAAVAFAGGLWLISRPATPRAPSAASTVVPPTVTSAAPPVAPAEPAESPPTPVDPIAYATPAEPPAPRERLTGEDYARRFAAALDGTRREAVPLDYPAVGLRVTRADADGPAGPIGLSVGDIVALVDGRTAGVPGQSMPGDPTAGGSGGGDSYTITFWSASAGARRSGLVPAGKRAFYGVGHWRPDVAYARSSDGHDPAWDDALRVAAAEFDRDPDLAETALYHARRAGYRGWLLPAIDAGAAFARGEPARALPLADAALARSDVPADQRLPLQERALRSAMADYKLPRAVELLADYPDPDAVEWRDDLTAALGRYRDRPARRAGPRLSPLDAAAADPLPDRTDLLAAAGDRGGDAVDRFRESGTLRLRANPGHYDLVYFAPDGPTVDVETSFRFEPSPGAATRFERVLRFGIHDAHRPNDRGGFESLASIGIHPDGTVSVIPHDAPRFAMPLSSATDWRDESHRIRLATGGGDFEVRLDGRRIYYGPIDYGPIDRGEKDAPAADEPARLGVHVQAVGIQADLFDLVYRVGPDRSAEAARDRSPGGLSPE